MSNTNKTTLRRMFTGLSFFVSLACIILILIGVAFYFTARYDYERPEALIYIYIGGPLLLIHFLCIKYLDINGR